MASDRRPSAVLGENRSKYVVRRKEVTEGEDVKLVFQRYSVPGNGADFFLAALSLNCDLFADGAGTNSFGRMRAGCYCALGEFSPHFHGESASSQPRQQELMHRKIGG